MLPVKAVRLFACALTLSLAVGCGDACRDLATRICKCLSDADGSRTACNQRAQSSETNFPVRAKDQAFCQHQLDTNACDCNTLDTAEGKAACGVSYTVKAPKDSGRP